jgi:CRISPR-associated protein Csd1
MFYTESHFPTIAPTKKLSYQSHKKEKRWICSHLEKKLSSLMCELDVSPFPARQDLKEQGMFILGYYHQTQKRYEKREEK